MSDSDDDDDVPRLSAHTLAALQEFYTETSLAGTTSKDQFAVGAVEEDWVRLVLMLHLCFLHFRFRLNTKSTIGTIIIFQADEPVLVQ